jgi:hypothetical protein
MEDRHGPGAVISKHSVDEWSVIDKVRFCAGFGQLTNLTSDQRESDGIAKLGTGGDSTRDNEKGGICCVAINIWKKRKKRDGKGPCYAAYNERRCEDGCGTVEGADGGCREWQ